jgi:hypothetical protein
MGLIYARSFSTYFFQARKSAGERPTEWWVYELVVFSGANMLSCAFPACVDTLLLMPSLQHLP